MSDSTNPFTSPSGKRATCMEMLQLYLDGEVTQEQRAYFLHHMDMCMPCFKGYQVDMAIKELLKTRCCGEGAPGDLVQQIKAQIAQQNS
ncbi:MAG: mycothiol system anti-sigma-R factor [Cyclobacteriaceae bacterium]|nr:mycothiol system anti-sigma-R factor [Cyclobacteriaceae bacterium]